MNKKTKSTIEDQLDFRASRWIKITLIVLIIILLFLAFEIIPTTIDEYFVSQRILRKSNQNLEEVTRRGFELEKNTTILEHLQPATESDTVLKVPVFEDAFWYGDRNSKDISGYGPRFLEEVSRFTGWKYQFIPMTVPEAQAALENGEVDILAPRLYYPNDNFIYTSKPIGEKSVIFLARSEFPITTKDVSSFNGLKFGAIKGTSDLEKLKQESVLQGFSYHLTVFDSNRALLKSLDEGAIDIAVASDICVSSKEPFKLIYSFDAHSIYFAVSPENTEIAKELNTALEKIEIADSGFQDKIAKELVIGRNHSSLSFTKDEIAYLDKEPEIRVGYLDNRVPIQYRPRNNERTSNGSNGILSQVLDSVAQKTGLKFIAIPYENSEELEDAITSGAIDMASSYSQNLEHPNYVASTPKYASFPIARLSKYGRDVDNSPDIALSNNVQKYASSLSAEHPNNTIVNTDTAAESFDLLSSGKVDYLYANLLEIKYLLHAHTAEDAYLVSYTSYTDDLAFSILLNSDPALLSIMRNALNSFSDEEKSNISAATTYPRAEGIGGFLSEYAVELALIFSMFLTALFIVLWLERRKMLSKVVQSAFVSQLTGLPNRHSFLVEIKAAISEGRTQGTALVAFDINNFKSINNLYSESFGNELLVHLAELIEKALPEGSFFAHDKADLFLMSIYNTSQEEVAEMLEKNILPLQHLHFKNAGSLELSFLMGVYMLQPEDLNAGAVLNYAEVACIEAKRDLSNPIKFFTKNMHQNLISDSILEKDLRLALARDEFIIHYQSKFDLQSLETTGYEALVRWNHPLAGIVSPNTFVPLAERLGVIHQLTKMVIRKVFADYHELAQEIKRENERYRTEGLDIDEQDLKISVNISAHDILENTIIDFLKAEADIHGIKPKNIQIEVTERVILDDKSLAIRRLNELKNHGFTIALDDFGTGYSSLGLISELPVDTVKIDKKFIRDIEVDEKARRVLRSIVHLINNLGIESLAEGIETEFQLEYLRKVGCQGGQGFYYSFPAPPDIVIQEYRKRKESN